MAAPRRFRTASQLLADLRRMARNTPNVTLRQHGFTSGGRPIVEMVAGDANAPNQVHVVANALVHGGNERASGVVYRQLLQDVAKGRFPGIVFRVLYADWDVIDLAEAADGLVRSHIEWPGHIAPDYTWKLKPNVSSSGSSWLREGDTTPESRAWINLCKRALDEVETRGGAAPLAMSGHSKNRGAGSHFNVAGCQEVKFGSDLFRVALQSGEPLATRNFEGFQPVDGIPGVFRHPLVADVSTGKKLVSDGHVALSILPNTSFVEVETAEQLLTTPEIPAPQLMIDVVCEMEAHTHESATNAARLMNDEGAIARLPFAKLAAGLVEGAGWQAVDSPVTAMRQSGEAFTLGELVVRASWGMRKALLAGVYHLEMAEYGFPSDLKTREIGARLWSSAFTAEQLMRIAVGAQPRDVKVHLAQHYDFTSTALGSARDVGLEMM